jgi:hypothetical protein
MSARDVADKLHAALTEVRQVYIDLALNGNGPRLLRSAVADALEEMR